MDKEEEEPLVLEPTVVYYEIDMNKIREFVNEEVSKILSEREVSKILSERVGDRLMKDAWERLATLPGDVGECARAELARMKGEKA